MVYVNFKQIFNQSDLLEEYIWKINEMCQEMDMIAWKGRNYFHDIAMVRLRRIRKIDEVIYEVTDKQDYRRIRRGVLNFVGKIGKILFGTPDDDNADYYNGKKIEHFERNSDILRELMKEEIYIVKSSFGTVEETLTYVQYNEENVKKGLTLRRLMSYIYIWSTHS